MNLLESFPLEVGADAVSERLDIFLSKQFPEVSRSRWAKLIQKKIFRIGDKTLAPAYKTRPGDRIDIETDEEEVSLADAAVAEKSTLTFSRPELAPDILFEDDHILVLNKPVDLGVHAGSGLKIEETLVAWLIENKKVGDPSSKEFLKWGEEALEEGRPGIVHRLDKGTSGTIVVAKNPKAHAGLAKQFETREAGREYWAVVEGSLARLTKNRPARLEALLRKNPCPVALRILEEGQHSFASYLDRDPKVRTRFRVCPDADGKRAVTHFSELKTNSSHSLLQLKLETGRTHQIRVHLSFLGYPIVGDDTYGGKTFRRLFLHAHSLRLKHPHTGELLQFHAPLPAADQQWLREEGLS